MPEAENALAEIGAWVESKNTPGSGYRFVSRFIDKIEFFALPNVSYNRCKTEELFLMGLDCMAIDKWIIAFKIEEGAFIVHYILHGSG